jgi:hypothetical protein
MHMKMKLNMKMEMTKVMNMKMKVNVKMRMEMITQQMEMRCCRFAGYADSQIKAAGRTGGDPTKVPKISHRIELR